MNNNTYIIDVSRINSSVKQVTLSSEEYCAFRNLPSDRVWQMFVYLSGSDDVEFVSEMKEFLNKDYYQLSRLGQVRQWLNEERITDPRKMVRTKDLFMMMYPLGTRKPNKSYNYSKVCPLIGEELTPNSFASFLFKKD